MSARKTTPRLGFAALMAVAAMVVVAAVGASTASANEFMSKTSMTHLLVLQLATQEFKVLGGTLVCSTVHGLALISTSLTSTVLGTPVYSGCEAISNEGAKLSATVNMKGCVYVFHAGTGTTASLSVGAVDIKCSTGNSITITAGTCTTTVSEQLGLEDAHYSLESGTLIEITPLIKGITYTTTSGLLCPLTAGTFSNGTYTGLLHASVTEGGPITEV